MRPKRRGFGFAPSLRTLIISVIVVMSAGAKAAFAQDILMSHAADREQMILELAPGKRKAGRSLLGGASSTRRCGRSPMRS